MLEERIKRSMKNRTVPPQKISPVAETKKATIGGPLTQQAPAQQKQ